MNPVSRVYPKNFIRTGISSIDCLATLIRGQKLPIFSGSGMKHNELAVQIVRQASLADDDDFAIVFAAMGVKNDVADYFRKSFEDAGVMDRAQDLIAILIKGPAVIMGMGIKDQKGSLPDRGGSSGGGRPAGKGRRRAVHL